MTTVPSAADSAPEGSGRPVNIVPSGRTRLAATLMAEATGEMSGYDAAIRYADLINADQWPAVVALLLEAGIRNVETRPNYLTAAGRRAAHAAFNRGERTIPVLAGERAYQRLRMRRSRGKASAA